MFTWVFKGIPAICLTTPFPKQQGPSFPLLLCHPIGGSPAPKTSQSLWPSTDYLPRGFQALYPREVPSVFNGQKSSPGNVRLHQHQQDPRLVKELEERLQQEEAALHRQRSHEKLAVQQLESVIVQRHNHQSPPEFFSGLTGLRCMPNTFGTPMQLTSSHRRLSATPDVTGFKS